MYDDYAHHPGELQALLTTARSLGYRRVICAFQPHTYTRNEGSCLTSSSRCSSCRTKVLWRRSSPPGRRILWGFPPGIWPSASWVRSSAPPWRRSPSGWLQLAQPGDLILTVGAGTSIWRGAPAGGAVRRELPLTHETKTPCWNAPHGIYILCSGALGHSPLTMLPGRPPSNIAWTEAHIQA